MAPDDSDDGDAGATSTRRRYLRRTAGIAAVGAGAVGGATLLAEPAGDHPWFRPDDPEVLVLAHAGGKALRPDNSLPAFDHAAAVGADVLETDVHLTADGVPVCIHDPTVDARTDGSGRVDELTLAELQTLDGAHTWSPPGSDATPYRGEGVTVPTLAAAFEAHPDARWNVELKPAVEDADPFCRVVREHGMERQVLSVSAEPVVADVRERCPAVATSTHRREVAHLLAASHLRLAGTYDAPAQAVQVPRRTSGVTVLTERFVEAAHGRGMDVHAWTINDPAEMRRLAEMGVDGLITDYPGRALSVLGRA